MIAPILLAFLLASPQSPPVRPIGELTEEALRATPPAETGTFRPSDLVELTTLDPTIRLDIRYATADNFLGTPVYTQARAFLQRPAAQALARVSKTLAPQGYGLLVHDAYRPWYVTQVFWDATPEDKHDFVADPAEGSRHNRGCAVDLGLYDLKSGKPVAMPSDYDEFSERAHSEYAGGSEEERGHRNLLRRAMEAEGFTVYPQEWWHFDYRDWKSYAIQNVRFEDLRPLPALGTYAGTYDTDALLRDPRIRGPLAALVGEALPRLLENLDVRGAVDLVGGWLQISGNAPHHGGEEEAVVCVATYDGRVAAAILSEGKIVAYSGSGSYDDLPICVKDWIPLAASGHRDRMRRPEGVTMGGPR